MQIELRTSGLRTPRARGLEWVEHTRQAFARLRRWVSRVVLRVSAADDAQRAGTRECVVEVHLADGRVERVQERHRRLGTLVRRALQRAWERVAVGSGSPPRDQPTALPPPTKRTTQR